MRIFDVKVNGKNYNVEVEEVSSDSMNSSVQKTNNMNNPSTPDPSPVMINSSPTVDSNAMSGSYVTSPMPGTIIDVKVSVGQTVGKNQVLIILEAMKMENEIVSPCDGKVGLINVKKGDSVNLGDKLVLIK